MKQGEILRVAQLCCSKILGDASVTLHDASDLNVQVVCSLWSGMGHIYKISVSSSVRPLTFVIKHVASPRLQSLGDRRKADSYQVEANFYELLAPILLRDHHIGIPRPFHVERDGGKHKNEIAIGMSFIESHVSSLSNYESAKAVLSWLAAFHASYWNSERVDAIVESASLQKQGSYWYLDTRPDEHESMPNKGWEGRLKRAAWAIDARLKRDPFQCLIHGDAKEANVLFSTNENGESRVVLCDFQYCGKGPPTKDLAYFLCNSANVDNEDSALEFYLSELAQKIPHDAVSPSLAELKESLALAYCDFYRFMSGWGFWGSGGEAKVKAVLDRLDGGNDLGSEEAYDEAVWREYG